MVGTQKVRHDVKLLRIIHDTDDLFQGHLHNALRYRMVSGFRNGLMTGFFVGIIITWLLWMQDPELTPFFNSGGPIIITALLFGLIFPLWVARFPTGQRVKITPRHFILGRKKYHLKDVGQFRANDSKDAAGRYVYFSYGRDTIQTDAQYGQDFRGIYDIQNLLNDRKRKFLDHSTAATNVVPENRAETRSAAF